jgi:hypothetical protein
VIGSLLLPVITTYESLWHKQLILTIVSLTVAVLSSLSTFDKWDYAWQTRMKAALELKGLLAKWELNLIAAQVAKNPAEEALTATKQLFDDSFKIVDTETGHPPGALTIASDERNIYLTTKTSSGIIRRSLTFTRSRTTRLHSTALHRNPRPRKEPS